MSRLTERATEDALARLDGGPDTPDGHLALSMQLFAAFADNMDDPVFQDRVAEVYLKAHGLRVPEIDDVELEP